MVWELTERNTDLCGDDNEEENATENEGEEGKKGQSRIGRGDEDMKKPKRTDSCNLRRTYVVNVGEKGRKQAVVTKRVEVETIDTDDEEKENSSYRTESETRINRRRTRKGGKPKKKTKT